MRCVLAAALPLFELVAQTPAPAPQSPPSQVPTTVVEARAGVAPAAATEGTVTRDDLAGRPLLRPGEVLETVPGLVLTQHSGNGKANQFFLRGFNLDHGTDLATWVGGVPVNMPSHGHGQGYTDVNFLIPELVDRVEWAKGPYRARDGNFASAGSVRVDYVDRLDRGFARLEGGSHGHQRGLWADSFAVGTGHLLVAAEARHHDGPWEVPADADTLNGVARWSQGDFRLTAMGYGADWTATDQIPARAAAAGSLSRFGSLDPTDGGQARRYSLAADWQQSDGDLDTKVTAYGLWSDLTLFSNFTYALTDPTAGDQFEQGDERVTLGLDASRSWRGGLAEREIETTVGVQIRHDRIRNGLHATAGRQRQATVRSDDISETALGLWVESRMTWTEWLRSHLGARGDLLLFDVESDRPVNSGHESDAIVSPKGGLVFGPWFSTELFVSAGFGFHSNDARGATLRDDPSTPAANDGSPVDPLVRSRGAEVGLRTTPLDELQSSLALFVLDLDSELLFVGDAGTTEASRASRRLGIEWDNEFRPWQGLTLDADLTLARARFRDHAPQGDHVPGAIDATASLAATMRWDCGLSAALRLRAFSSRALTEDDRVRSGPTTLVHAKLGYEVSERTTVDLTLLNLLDVEHNEIEYFYPSRLRGEPPGPDDGGYNDRHFHPVEPFSLQFAVTTRF